VVLRDGRISSAETRDTFVASLNTRA
jgi:hypothetical protein